MATSGRFAPDTSGSVRGLISNLLTLLQIRLELWSLETEEEIARLVRPLTLWLLGLASLALGLQFVALALVAWTFDPRPVGALAVAAAVFLLLAGLLTMAARSSYRTKPRLWAASIGEVERDRTGIQAQ